MTRISILIRRGAVVPFAELPTNFAALDGYSRGPALDPINRRFSFDHHEGCIRMVTHATCEQVLDAILLGLDVDGLTLGVNDVDEDTVLAAWLMLHPERSEDEYVQSVVHVMGLRDAHGPAYPLNLQQQAVYAQAQGAFAPLYQEWADRTYGTCDLDALMETLLWRLDRWLLDGEAFDHLHEAEPEWRIYYRDDYMVVIESSRIAMEIVYSLSPRGISFTYQPDGSIGYTIGRRSDLVHGFDVSMITARLAEVEPGWGGGSSIGGAPRHPDGSRSRLDPDLVIEIVRDAIGGG